jgi:predicted  nucleic acid-binding Zn ribbon protein
VALIEKCLGSASKAPLTFSKTMNVNIEFNTDNAAFEDSFLMEVTRTLQQCKSALLDSERGTITIRRPIKDSNGNRIGVVSIGNN